MTADFKTILIYKGGTNSPRLIKICDSDTPDMIHEKICQVYHLNSFEKLYDKHNILVPLDYDSFEEAASNSYLVHVESSDTYQRNYPHEKVFEESLAFEGIEDSDLSRDYLSQDYFPDGRQNIPSSLIEYTEEDTSAAEISGDEKEYDDAISENDCDESERGSSPENYTVDHQPNVPNPFLDDSSVFDKISTLRPYATRQSYKLKSLSAPISVSPKRAPISAKQQKISTGKSSASNSKGGSKSKDYFESPNSYKSTKSTGKRPATAEPDYRAQKRRNSSVILYNQSRSNRRPVEGSKSTRSSSKKLATAKSPTPTPKNSALASQSQNTRNITSPSPDPSSTTAPLIKPSPCPRCRQRHRGCDRIEPICGRCSKDGITGNCYKKK